MTQSTTDSRQTREQGAARLTCITHAVTGATNTKTSEALNTIRMTHPAAAAALTGAHHRQGISDTHGGWRTACWIVGTIHGRVTALTRARDTHGADRTDSGVVNAAWCRATSSAAEADVAV